ncbi:MAG: hypothetical protein Q8941_04880 [Bacteroidota bacterium]|nr:hypothetical protein [Bacteroidota bacterium]
MPPASYPGKEKIPFGRIELADYRFDTSKVGYNVHNRIDERIAVKGGLEKTLAGYLNNYFKNNLDTSSGKTLLIVLKRLWLQSGAIGQMLLSKEKDYPDLPYYLNKAPACLADIDVFAVSGAVYKALVRINHSFNMEEINTVDNLSALLLPFDSLLKKISLMDVDKVISQKKDFSLEDIRKNYENRFTIPVLTQGNLQRGVYLTFSDFKESKTSYPDFTYKIDRFSADVTIRQGQQSIIITDYWGFFDGKNLFVKPGHVPFKVIRQGHTFDFYGSLRGDTHDNTFDTYNGVQMRYTVSVVPLYPLQVDMDTGKVY